MYLQPQEKCQFTYVWSCSYATILEPMQCGKPHGSEFLVPSDYKSCLLTMQQHQFMRVCQRMSDISAVAFMVCQVPSHIGIHKGAPSKSRCKASAEAGWDGRDLAVSRFRHKQLHT